MGSAALRALEISPRRAELALQGLHPALDSPPDPPPRSEPLHKALALAVDESRWLGQHYIGTEHLLLGILRGGGGEAPALLHLHDVSAEQIRRRVRRLIRSGATEIDLEAARTMARLSELSRRILNAAEQVAHANGQREVSVAHLLLALSQEERSACSRVLRECGFRAEALAGDLGGDDPVTGGAVDAVLSMAVDQADRLGSPYTGADHMLLAVCLHPRAARLLQMYNAQPQAVALRVRDLIGR